MPPVKEKDATEGEPRQRKRPGRVPVSCAECRRLKLRCDRKVPCETCTKRGCAALCPDGQLITGGKGTRQAVADVEDLKKKIEQLQNRSKTLEDALRTIQAAVSDEQHPLLVEGENGAASSPSASASASMSSPSSNESASEAPSLTVEEADVLDAFGTLTLGSKGESRYFGQTSRSEYLIHAPERLCETDLKLPRLSDLMVEEANKELDVKLTSCELGHEMLRLLPPLSQACQLCETFLEFGKFAWYPMSRECIFDEIIRKVYNLSRENCDITVLHSLALLWIIYALATLFDQNMPPYAVEAHEYYLLSRAALRFAPPAHDTTLPAIQTMIYMTQYLEMSDCEPAHTASHKAWMQIGQAAKLGHSIGLHVRSSRWRLSEDAAIQRNSVFWQLFMQDTWLSFGFGRPPSINLDFVECEIPKEPEVISADQDKREAGFHIWTWQYTKLLYSIMTTAFGAKQPPYAKVMELDRKVRDFPVPSSLRVQCGVTENPPPSMALNVQRLLATMYKETTLLNLHRPYFSQAVNDKPDDPLRHKYGPSVMAIYRSAWRIFASIKCAYRAVPGIASRMGLIWSHALSGSIVMCLLVIRAPSSNLAQASLTELDKLCELFEEASNQSQIARNNIEVIRKLRKQAHAVMNNAHATEESAQIHNELDRLGGKTHLMRPKEDYSFGGPPTSAGDGGSSATMSTPNGTCCEPPVQPELIHPTIMRDMRAFDGELWGGTPMEASTSGPPLNFNLDFPSTSFPNPQQAEFPLFPDFDFASPSAAQGVSPAAAAVPPLTSSSSTPAVVSEPWQQHPMRAALDPPPGVPVLDASWQAFVEQLGFSL
ncbi:fungal-specific transcription factor domain-containing protein [Cubamyces lactineus]|nr:fungal-specific transcription factor domain-containing protein [Cubamyces lactineus]